ncbi:hypothetical protein ACFL30_02715 [Candidatus Latescibacterota bacterium]
MEQWTDKAIKQHVEELIEESFILTLSDDEMKEYFRDFIDVCDFILQSNISIHNDLKILRIKTALLKARLFVDQNVLYSTRRGVSNATDDGDSRRRLFAQQIIKNKRAIMRFLELFDSQVAFDVIEESLKRQQSKRKDFVRRTKLHNIVLTTGYYLLLTGAVTLTLYMWFH